MPQLASHKLLSLLQDNLFEWEVELSEFPKESLLAKDLGSYATRTGRKAVVTMEMKFPKDYPMNPPFVRILRPRFKFLTGEQEYTVSRASIVFV